MNRNVRLLACLATFVCGIALEVPASDTGDPPKPCCAENKLQGSKVGTAPYTCLQAELYVAGEISLYSADIFSDDSCSESPEPTELWRPSNQDVPQSCLGSPGCNQISGKLSEVCPAIKRPLPKNKGYAELLDHQLHYPGLPAEATWNAKDPVADLGELRTTFRKVKNVKGQYFAVRLSIGIVEMGKVRFPAGANPVRPKIADRKILIGFETEMDQSDVDKLAEAFPTAWERYPECPTAFRLNVDNCDYGVTVTTANAVKVAGKVIKPAPTNSATK